MTKYSLKDVGCYQDGSVRNSVDILDFIKSHGFEPGDFDKEFVDEVIDEGIDYLNDNLCDDVYFVFEDGDLLLKPAED